MLEKHFDRIVVNYEVPLLHLALQMAQELSPVGARLDLGPDWFRGRARRARALRLRCTALLHRSGIFRGSRGGIRCVGAVSRGGNVYAVRRGRRGRHPRFAEPIIRTSVHLAQ